MSGEGTYDVVGRCPACGWHSLTLAAGGYVTCSRLDCPRPEAATDLLGGLGPIGVMRVNPSEAVDSEELARVIAEHREQPWMVLPPAVGLSSSQLRRAAEGLRRRYSPPSVAMSPGEYLVHEGLRALADALEDVAAVQTEGGS